MRTIKFAGIACSIHASHCKVKPNSGENPISQVQNLADNRPTRRSNRSPKSNPVVDLAKHVDPRHVATILITPVNFPHQDVQRMLLRRKIGSRDIRQLQQGMLVLPPDHFDFALTKWTIPVEKHLKRAINGTFCAVIQKIHDFSKTFNSFSVKPIGVLRDNGCNAKKHYDFREKQSVLAKPEQSEVTKKRPKRSNYHGI